MAQVMPFRGVRYNLQRIKDLSQVVTPPYDVINEQAQEYYHQLHEYNVIRLILGRKYPSDNPRNNWFTRAAAFYKEWQESGVLARDPDPGVYLYEIEYRLEEEAPQRRTGLIALVKLEEFGSGSVRPHEKTFSATRNERFRLIKSCGANFSPIFTLYSDPENRVLKRLSAYKRLSPLFTFKDEFGIFHRMWQVTDPEALREVHDFFAARELFIADGHHRYETALRYYKYLSKNMKRKLDHLAPAFVMMYLCPMEGGELTVLPAHRMLSNWPQDLALEEFLEGIERYFEVRAFRFNEINKLYIRFLFQSALKEKAGQTNAFGFYLGGLDRYFLFSLRNGVLDGGKLGDVREELRKLDVMVLTRLIFQEIMGMDEEDLDNETNINYTSKFNPALDLVEEGRFAASFLLNPTPIDQVRRVAQASLIMPRKSTYFYPKVTTGLVFNNLDPAEEIVLP